MLYSLKGGGGSGLQKFEVRSSRGLKFSSGVVTFLISAIHLSRWKLVEGVDRPTVRRHGLRCLLWSRCPTDLILASKKSNSNEKKRDQDRSEVGFIHETMTQNLQESFTGNSRGHKCVKRENQHRL